MAVSRLVRLWPVLLKVENSLIEELAELHGGKKLTAVPACTSIRGRRGGDVDDVRESG